MNPITVIILTFVIVGGVTVLASMAMLRLWPVLQRGRLATSAGDSNDEKSILRWSDQPTAGWQRTVERIGRAVGSSEETAPSKYRQRLMWAGYYEPRTVVVFVGTKIALAALFGSAYFLYSSFVFLRVVPFTQLLAISLILAGIGFFLPDFWLNTRIKVRQRAIVHALPDILDLLMVCVEAGMQVVGARTTGPIVKLASVRVGDAEAEDVTAVVHPIGPGIHGLLGNSFLARFTVTLDPQEGVLHLRPR